MSSLVERSTKELENSSPFYSPSILYRNRFKILGLIQMPPLLQPQEFNEAHGALANLTFETLVSSCMHTLKQLKIVLDTKGASENLALVNHELTQQIQSAKKVSIANKIVLSTLKSTDQVGFRYFYHKSYPELVRRKS